MLEENIQPNKTEYDHLIEQNFIHPLGLLRNRNYSIADISWIGTRDEEVDIQSFLDLLKEIPLGSLPPFESGFLGWRIVMKDGNWFEGDLDYEWGTSFWQFHELPIRPADKLEVTCVADIIGEYDDK